jgi:hypothetical protein
MYMLQAKIKGKVCTHTLPHTTIALEPASLLREGFSVATCPRLRTPPLCLGGLQCCHVPRGSELYLAIQEGAGTATRVSTSVPASPLRRGPVPKRVLQL